MPPSLEQTSLGTQAGRQTATIDPSDREAASALILFNQAGFFTFGHDGSRETHTDDIDVTTNEPSLDGVES